MSGIIYTYIYNSGGCAFYTLASDRQIIPEKILERAAEFAADRNILIYRSIQHFYSPCSSDYKDKNARQVEAEHKEAAQIYSRIKGARGEYGCTITKQGGIFIPKENLAFEIIDRETTNEWEENEVRP